MSTTTLAAQDFGISETLKRLGIHDVNPGASTGTKWLNTTGEIIESYAPADGKLIGKIQQATAADYENIIAISQEAFKKWRIIYIDGFSA